MPGAIMMRHHTGERLVLTRLEPQDARETLGVYLSMAFAS
jgi:hypothetical protein